MQVPDDMWVQAPYKQVPVLCGKQALGGIRVPCRPVWVLVGML